MTEQKDQNDVTGQYPPPTIVEWSMRIFSGLIMLLLLAYLVYSAVQPQIGPNFALQIHHDEIEERRNGWAVPYTIRNNGTVAIGDVMYELRLFEAGREVETKQGRIAIFGAGESVKGETWFEADPRDGELALSVDTYTL